MQKSLPVLTIITAKGCDFCEIKRGKGPTAGLLIDPPANTPPTILGDHYWNQAFFRKLLTGTIEGATTGSVLGLPILPAKSRIFEMHYGDYNLSNGPSELNEFILIGNDVVRLSYTKDKRTNKIIVNITKDGKTSKQKNPPSVDFTVFVNSKVPKDITRYVRGFPAFVYTDGNNWDNAIKGTESLYSHVQGWDIIQMGIKDNIPFYGVTRDRNAVYKREIDPILFMRKIIPDDNGNVILDISGPEEMSNKKQETTEEENKLAEERRIAEELRIEKERLDFIRTEEEKLIKESEKLNIVPAKYISHTYCQRLPYKVHGR